MKLILGDCLEKLKDLPDNSVDSIVTDPPYGLSFMGKKWDYDVPSVDIWKECLRVLKPGGHLLSFSGSRTYHRMAVRIEDAGFEIRDQIMWIYGSGFPKSHKVGDGWGTALKPAHEPIVMARKPFKGSAKNNVLEWGTGGLNIDESRVGYKDTSDRESVDRSDRQGNMGWRKDAYVNGEGEHTLSPEDAKGSDIGRWPANIILDEEAGEVLDQQSGISGTGKKKLGKDRQSFFDKNSHIFGSDKEQTNQRIEDYGDKGGASRFFYCPKASKKDRDEGLDNFEEKAQRQSSGGSRDFNARCANCGKKFIGSPETICSCDNPITDNTVFKKKNNHPTVKPTELMLYLIKLVTPKGGTVLEPFMGSGSTGKAAIRGGFDFIGIEKEEEYLKIAEARIEHEYGSKH
jgi:site-specific DNA-methyltransferase (adenine-specific)